MSRLYIRIDDTLKASAQSRADAEGVTLSDVVRDLLTEWAGGEPVQRFTHDEVADEVCGVVSQAVRSALAVWQWQPRCK